MPVALPELGDIAAFLFLLLIAAALWVLAELLRQTLGRIPGIGSWVTSHIVRYLDDAREAILRAAHATWDAGIRLIEWFQQLYINTFVRVYLWAADVTNAISHIATVQLPLAIARLAGEARTLYDRSIATARVLVAESAQLLEHDIRVVEGAVEADYDAALAYAAGLYHQALAALEAGIATAEQLAATEVVQLDHRLTADLQGLRADLAADYTQLQAQAVQLFRTAEADLTLGIQTAEQLAAFRLAAVRAGIYTDLETWGDQAIQLAWPDWSGDLAALRKALQGDFPWLNDLIGALGGLGAAGLVGALIRSLAGVHALTNLATDCIVPTCRNLSGLGNALHQLLSLGMDAALLAWVGECIADPVAAAADTYAVAGPLVADTVGALEQLLGVKVA